uniref:ParB/RepB/Spo0J family partition protein n=1 Tax=Thermorudis peleae TaxID=1382356 RepID=A0A831TDN7_9BACT
MSEARPLQDPAPSLRQIHGDQATTGSQPLRRRRRFTVDALFADTSPRAVGTRELATAKEIRLDRIEPDPDQPRRSFDEERLEELAASIRLEGVLQPIAVRYDAERDRYVIIHGERRWRAAQLAGLESIPAIVREVGDEQRLIQQLMENILREDLNALDRAAALRRLKRQMGDAPWEQVAEAVGIKRSRLFQLLSTEKLPEPVQAEIRAGRLSEKQSRPLHGLPERAQAALAELIVEEGLEQREIERLARALRAAPELAQLPAEALRARLRELTRAAVSRAVTSSRRGSRRVSRASELVTALERLRQLLEGIDPGSLDAAERQVIAEAMQRLAPVLRRWQQSTHAAPGTRA